MAPMPDLDAQEREAMVEAMEAAWPHLEGCWSSVDLGEDNWRRAEVMFKAGLRHGLRVNLAAAEARAEELDLRMSGGIGVASSEDG